MYVLSASLLSTFIIMFCFTVSRFVHYKIIKSMCNRSRNYQCTVVLPKLQKILNHHFLISSVNLRCSFFRPRSVLVCIHAKTQGKDLCLNSICSQACIANLSSIRIQELSNIGFPGPKCDRDRSVPSSRTAFI